MNHINTIHTSFITNNKTIDCIELVSPTNKTFFYLYNYKGIHYRLFSCLLDIICFFKNEQCCFIEFENDDEIDSYLENYSFK